MALNENNTQLHNLTYNKTSDTSSLRLRIKPSSFWMLYAFAVTVLSCLSDNSNGGPIALVVTAAFLPLVFKPEYLVCPVLFLTIFDDYILLRPGASVSRFVTLFLILGAVLILLQRGKIQKVSFHLMLLLAIGTFLSLFSVMGYTSIPISYIFNVLLAIAMVNLSTSSPATLVKQFLWYGALALVYVYSLLAKNGIDSLVDGARMTIGEGVNSNALAMGLAIVLSTLVCNLLLFKQHTLISILLIGATLVALFLTGSRTALIAAIATSFLLYIFCARDKRSKRNAFFFVIFSGVLLVVVYSFLQKHFPILMERFTAENVEASGGSGRLDIWRSYFLYLFPKYWFIGMGFHPSNFIYAIGAINAEAHGCHNLLVELLSKTGVAGTLVYSVHFVFYMKAMLKTLDQNKYLLCSIAIVSTILINGIGEDVLLTRFLWLGIGLGYMLLNSSTNDVSKGDQNV